MSDPALATVYDMSDRYSRSLDSSEIEAYYDTHSFEALAAFGAHVLSDIKYPGGQDFCPVSCPQKDQVWATDDGRFCWSARKSFVFALLMHMRDGHSSLRASLKFQTKAGRLDVSAWHAIDGIFSQRMVVAKEYWDQRKLAAVRDILSNYRRSFDLGEIISFYNEHPFDTLALFGPHALRFANTWGGGTHPVADQAWDAGQRDWTPERSFVFGLVLYMRDGKPSLRESPTFQAKAEGFDVRPWYDIDRTLTQRMQHSDKYRPAKAASERLQQERAATSLQKERDALLEARAAEERARAARITARRAQEEADEARHIEWQIRRQAAEEAHRRAHEEQEARTRAETARVWLDQSFESKAQTLGITPSTFFNKAEFPRERFLQVFQVVCTQSDIAGRPPPSLVDAEVAYLLGAVKYYTQNPPNPYWRMHPETTPQPQPLGSSLLLFNCWKKIQDADDISEAGQAAWKSSRQELWKAVKPTSFLPKRPDLEGGTRDAQGLLCVPFPRPPVIDRPVVEVGDVVTCPKCRTRYEIHSEGPNEFLCDGDYHPPGRKGPLGYVFPPVEKCNYHFTFYLKQDVDALVAAYKPLCRVFDKQGDWLKNEQQVPPTAVHLAPPPYAPFFIEHAPPLPPPPPLDPEGMFDNDPPPPPIDPVGMFDNDPPPP